MPISNPRKEIIAMGSENLENANPKKGEQKDSVGNTLRTIGVLQQMFRKKRKGTSRIDEEGDSGSVSQSDRRFTAGRISGQEAKEWLRIAQVRTSPLFLRGKHL